MIVAFHSTMIPPPNSLHAPYNRSSESCRALGISTQLHQTLLDAVSSANQHEPVSALPLPEAIAQVAEIGLRDNTYFASHDANAAAN